MKFTKGSLFLILVLGLLASACNPTKYVPDNEHLLNDVKIETDNKAIPKEDISTYIRQTPNNEIFGIYKMQLGIYNLAGADSSKWINRRLKKIGEEPVIYNPSLTTITEKEITKLTVKDLKKIKYHNIEIFIDTKEKRKPGRQPKDPSKVEKINEYYLRIAYI